MALLIFVEFASTEYSEKNLELPANKRILNLSVVRRLPIRSFNKVLEREILTKNGKTIIMDFDGGVDMIVLLVMPSKGIKIKEIDTIFSGQELKDFETVLDLVDRYMCCPSLDDF